MAMYREQQCYARYLLEAQDISRFDLINYVSHGVSKLPEEESQQVPGADEEEEGGQRPQRNPLEAFTVELVEKAEKGLLDPLIGRNNEIARTIHVLCRRRKNKPHLRGRPRAWAKPPSPRGWPCGSMRRRFRRCCTTPASTPSTWARCWPAPSSAASSSPG